MNWTENFVLLFGSILQSVWQHHTTKTIELLDPFFDKNFEVIQ